MTRVQVTFQIESDEPEDDTGLTAETHERVFIGIGRMGGYDIEFDKIEEEDEPEVERSPKPARPKGG